MAMIHIATVHYQSPKWIDIQYRYLKKNVNEFRLYGFFSKNIEKRYARNYDFASFTSIKEHQSKLSVLGDIICHSSGNPDDVVCFLDGDAFPIFPIDGYIEEKLSNYPLIAIQRLEEAGDLYPHPSFCATRIKTWLDLEGNWSRGPTGYYHRHTKQPAIDVGGALLGILDSKRIDWYPLHRTNNNAYDKVMFGIYDSVIYHHGCGFHNDAQTGRTRSESDEEQIRLQKHLQSRLLNFFEKICLVISAYLVKLNSLLRDKYHPIQISRKKSGRKIDKINSYVYRMICDDEGFHTRLIQHDDDNDSSSQKSD